MSFASGSITFKRFLVNGQSYARVDQDLLDKLSARAITADSIRTAEQTELGWTTGDHILDTDFDFAKNAIADGLHFALRIDAHKPPTDLIRSYQKINERAMLEASGREFLNKVQRREAREQALARAEAEARDGSFRRMKQIPAFWDLKRNEVYLGSTSTSAADQFMLLFRETFDCALTAASAGEMAARWSAHTGEVSAFDNCQPAYFINPPHDTEADFETTNINEGRSKDFLGTEWLTWLLYATQVESPETTTRKGDTITVLFEKSLRLECAFKITGTTTVQAEGPTRLPETAVALAGGKRPTHTGLQMARHGDTFGLKIRGDVMNLSGVQLPPVQEAVSVRVVFEERIDHLRDLVDAVEELYIAFLKRRLSNKWPKTLNAMRNWIASGRFAGAESVQHSPTPLEAV